MTKGEDKPKKGPNAKKVTPSGMISRNAAPPLSDEQLDQVVGGTMQTKEAAKKGTVG